MNNIATLFSIKDLENLSGIKAHTIRIWEKRYALLVPNRTDSNIRYYDLDNLKKLLNISILNSHGYKISKIADLSSDELEAKVREYISGHQNKEHFVNSLKVAMLNYDRNLFEHTYNTLVAESSFRDVFVNTLIPFLQRIGLEWLSNSITPVHEHFITNLIKQKLLVNIERVQQVLPKNPEHVFVLYLPMNEIHEFGLLYLHYELLLKGKYSVFLGPSVPIDNLKTIEKVFRKITYISYFTVKPATDEVMRYLTEVQDLLLKDTNHDFIAFGKQTAPFIEEIKQLSGIKVCNDIMEFTNDL